MALLDSLLTAVVRADGDALVLHVGERPTVVTPSGPVELSRLALTAEAMTALLNQLLPGDRRRTLAEFGAVDVPVAPRPVMGGDQFAVVAARGGDDIWIELRRSRRPPPVERAPAAPAPLPPRKPASSPDPGGTDAAPSSPAAPRPVAVATGPSPRREPDDTRPLTRTVRIAVPPRQAPPPPHAPDPGLGGHPQAGAVERLLGEAARRQASALYLLAGQRPYLRIDGDLVLLEGEPAPTGAEVDAALLGLAPEDRRAALVRGVPDDWVIALAGVGRVRCITFRDGRGAGAVLHLVPSRVASAATLGLTREIQGLAAETAGLVILAAPRGGGKSTLAAALVDLVNRSRAGYVVTLERRTGVLHENARALVSQRGMDGNEAADVASARAALREDPDVLVVDDVRSAGMLDVAIDAAAAGHLVVATVTAGSTSGAIGRLHDLVAPDRRAAVRAVMAGHLRGVVSQVLLRKAGGGRLAARELLLNTPAVASLLAEGRVDELPLAIEHGRRHGMFPLNDALVAFVQSGAVDVRDAWRTSDDRPGLVALLGRHGLDTSFAERMG